MLRASILLVCTLAACIPTCSAQQMPGATVPNTWPSISSDCRTALNMIVNCPWFLIGIATENPRLPPDQLTALCTTQCLDDLTSALANIRQACPAPANHIDIDGATYPATWMVDNYLYTYRLSCQKDPASNQFCDTLRTSWLVRGSTTHEEECSDCVLGGMVTMLSSPFGFDEQFEEDFRSRTSSCGKSTYSYTTPSPYTLNIGSTTTSTTIPTPSCRATHAVTGADDCESIARKYSVSTFSLISLNGLDFKCHRLRWDMTLCIDIQCPTYSVSSRDSCDSIVAASNGAFDGNQLVVWNPFLDDLCLNLHDIPSNIICVGPPGGTIPAIQGTAMLAPSIPVTAAPVPTNVAPNSTAICGTWYSVKSGDTCSLISVKFSITVDDFVFLNPGLNANCTNLWLGTAYCVKAVGSIKTYPGYRTTTAGNMSIPYTLTSEQYTTETWRTHTPQVSVPPAPTAIGLAPGTWSNCSYYKIGFRKPEFVEQLAQPELPTFYVPSLNDCQAVASVWGITMGDFLTWNPSLVAGDASGNCTLSPDFQYGTLCGTPSPRPDAIPMDNMCDNGSVDYALIKPGTDANCNCYTTVVGIDKGLYDCTSLQGHYNVTPSQILAWNTWAGTDCNGGIYTGLSINDTNTYNVICVGVGKSKSNTTSIMSASASRALQSLSSTTATASAAVSTVSGMISDCKQLYTVQSGDGCSSIESQFSITFSQFYAWNPAVGSNCENLWSGYSYCVSAASPTSSRSVATSASSPSQMQTQQGIPPGCARYHSVVSQDTCGGIAATYGITLSQFYAWNPPVQTNCSALWLGYSYCVAGGPQS